LNKRKLLLAIIAILAICGVAFGAYLVLWTRTPTILITTQQYQARLLSGTQDIPNMIAEASSFPPEATTLSRTPTNDHEYRAVIVFDNVIQIDTVTLRLSVPDIPVYISTNISSINLVTVQYNGSPNWEVVSSTNIASNIAANSTVTFPKTGAIYDTGIMHMGFTQKVGLVILFSEYQIAPTTDTSATLHPSFDLMT
jgi:hypothetical protein